MDSNCGKNTSSDRMICDPRQGFHQDWTINLLQYGLLLYSSNIRTAYYMKCHQENVKGLCQKLKYISRLEWNLLLSKASSQIQSPQSVNRNKIITFNMDINVTFVIFSLEDGLIKVGEYKNNELTWDKNYGEENEETLNLSSTCVQFKIRPTKSTITTNYHNIIIPYYAGKSSFENIINFRNLGHIQMIGIVCGIGFGITIILTFVFYNVYRGFNIVTNRTSSFSSRTT
uniref:Uncharacterized protein n=2 Tax=Rhodnius prolixus TaxID=13249 RepID=T1HYN5_RHOPR